MSLQEQVTGGIPPSTSPLVTVQGQITETEAAQESGRQTRARDRAQANRTQGPEGQNARQARERPSQATRMVANVVTESEDGEETTGGGRQGMKSMLMLAAI